MHKTILFLLAFLITPITASYAVDSTTPCKETCSVKTGEIKGNKDDFVCKWIKISNGATPTNGVISGNCQKKWYCKEDGYYIKVHTKTIDNGTAITNQFSHVSCEPCPSACHKDDTDCINNDNKNTRTQTTNTYSAAQSVNDCYLKMQHPSVQEEITGSDEIGSFRTKKTDTNPYTCPY